MDAGKSKTIVEIEDAIGRMNGPVETYPGHAVVYYNRNREAITGLVDHVAIALNTVDVIVAVISINGPYIDEKDKKTSIAFCRCKEL